MVEKKLSKTKIKNLTKTVLEEAKKDNVFVEEAYLFGSYAKGTQKKDSDLDLCFVSSKVKDTIEMEAYFRVKFFYALKNIALDIVSYRTKDFRDKCNTLAYEIKRTGLGIM